jgi:hypothetical protein
LNAAPDQGPKGHVLKSSEQKPRFLLAATKLMSDEIAVGNGVDLDAQPAKTTLFAGGKETMSDEIAAGNFVQ